MTIVPESTRDRRRRFADPSARDRSRLATAWYRLIQAVVGLVAILFLSLRASGRGNVPRSGGVLLVSNHLSHLDSFVLGLPLSRPLNYVARSTLFLPVLGPLIRSVGGFPIQREGLGASGIKETLKRLRSGGIVALFPEGTRSLDGRLAPIKAGTAALATRARVPIVPAGIAGTFEAWPRDRRLPRPGTVVVHYGPAILPDELDGLSPEAITDLISDRLRASRREAIRRLRLADRGSRAASDEFAVGRSPAFG